jgi:hypothetical protein
VEAAAYRTPTKTRILGGAPHSIKQQIVRYDIDEPARQRTRRRDAALSARLAAAARGRRRRDPLRLRLRRDRAGGGRRA